jgi:hypothetical protein
MGDFKGTVSISQNPVLNWEQFAETYPPAPYQGVRGFDNLQLVDSAEWGNDSAKFTLYNTFPKLISYLEGGLCRAVSIFSPDMIDPWEGFIYEMVLDQGVAQVRVSIKDVWNDIWMRFQITGSGSTSRSTEQQDATSEARFGIRTLVATGGELPSLGVADQRILQLLTLMSWPMAIPQSFKVGGKVDRRPVKLEINCKGWGETLGWQVYNQTVNTSTESSSQLAIDIITAKSQFITAGEIDANGTQVQQKYDVDRRPKDLIADICRLGDAQGNRWLPRIVTGRKLNVKQAAPPTLPPIAP